MHKPFDRIGSTLGVMDDLQVAVHSYDGCARGCSGCIVDKHFKNHGRFKPILNVAQMQIIESRVAEYYDWATQTLNTKETGYFGRHGYQIAHRSYTMRFGNHSELPAEALQDILDHLKAPFMVFSTAPNDNLDMFAQLQQADRRLFLEIIYDPIADRATDIRDMILQMRAQGMQGYPEVLITRRLISAFTPARFVDECVAPLGNIGTQMQFGRYTPSKTRAFNQSQMVTLDEEVTWLAAVARRIVQGGYDIHPIPLGEYAVTLLDEYGEAQAQRADGSIDLALLPAEEIYDVAGIREKVRDIFLSSLYIDHNLDVYVWSESMGQHVLDHNFGYPALGNLRDASLQDILTRPQGGIDRMLAEVTRELIKHPKCAPCRYKSFCASHAIPLFRNWHQDDGAHCYGYLPVIRAFQQDRGFLENMVQGFKDLEF